MATRGKNSSVSGVRGACSWAQVVAGGTTRTAMTAEPWPKLGGPGVADPDVDSQVLAQMEAREDRERGADDRNADTFGAEPGTWSFEQQLAANRALWEAAQAPPEPQPEVEQQPAPPPPPQPEPQQPVEPLAMPLDPAWVPVAARLAEEQRRFLKFAEYSSGLLWGRCACCEKWVCGADHFGSKEHVKRSKWWAGPDASDSGVGSDGPATSAPAPPAATARSPEVKVFYPTGFSGSTVDGALLVDSFFYMKDTTKTKRDKQKVEYLPELLAELRRDTGLVFMAVCSGGATLANPGEWSASFEELLERVPAGVRMILREVWLMSLIAMLSGATKTKS